MSNTENTYMTENESNIFGLSSMEIDLSMRV